MSVASDSSSPFEFAPHTTWATNTTHLMWVGRWIEVVQTPDGWRFKRTQDALDWLRYE